MMGDDGQKNKNPMHEAREALDRHPRCGAHCQTTGKPCRNPAMKTGVAGCTVENPRADLLRMAEREERGDRNMLRREKCSRALKIFWIHINFNQSQSVYCDIDDPLLPTKNFLPHRRSGA